MDLVQHITLDNMLFLRECGSLTVLALVVWLVCLADSWLESAWVKVSIHAKRAGNVTLKKNNKVVHMAMPICHVFFQNKIFSGLSQLSANYLYKATSMFSTDAFHSGATGPPSPKRTKICLSEDTTTGMPCMIQCVVWRKSMYLFWSHCTLRCIILWTYTQL